METPAAALDSAFPARRVVASAAMLAFASLASAQPKATPAAEALAEALIIEPVGTYGREPIHLDAIEHHMLEGSWQAPGEGDTITGPDGAAREWTLALANDEGWLSDRALRDGYALWTYESPGDRIMILHAEGPAASCINGAWRVGDVYQTGWTHIPVALREGENELLFHVSRGALRASLREPTGLIEFNTAEATLPTLVVGEPADTVGAVVLINATNEWMRGLTIRSECDALGVLTETEVPALPPCTIRKVAFAIECDAPRDASTHELALAVHNEANGELVAATLPIRVVSTDDVIQRTFVSDIDGSVQHYAVRYATEAEDATHPMGLILTLHGAGVEALRQASCYTSKSWAHIVAPTNRRPFGFDWEDWGRLDALEVLDRALDSLDADPNRVAVTGHSMGGHGTWHLAVHDLEKFVAAAPSAGWVSFWSYTGAREFEDDGSVDAMLRRATLPSRTLEYVRNLANLGVYILHGEQDHNVPVEHARLMRSALGEFHTDFAYHEEPGAGHWWGDQCVDYPPLMDFLRRRMDRGRQPGEVPVASPLRAARPGPFKDAFRNHTLFVVGTQGSPEENGVNMNKARFDAETFWYRGNGSIDIMLDRDFDPDAHADRNIILYGNADSNCAWPALLADSPVQVRNGAIDFGGQCIEGDNFACIMIRPRNEHTDASVAVISGTSARGMQAAMRLPYFVSGVAYPDVMIWSSDALMTGTDAIEITGYFGEDWSIESGDFARRD